MIMKKTCIHKCYKDIPLILNIILEWKVKGLILGNHYLSALEGEVTVIFKHSIPTDQSSDCVTFVNITIKNIS